MINNKDVGYPNEVKPKVKRDESKSKAHAFCEQLDNRIMAIQESINILERKLDSVLIPVVPEEDSDNVPNATVTDSPLSIWLSLKIDSTDKINDQIASIIHRLDI